ncbi:hypothetical protein FPV67DRAFT_1169918 [Lyophyllum atratum]|nr:hypothetical protein FPV67DRAFT_1169918 [Lyophyllum atratum]
MASLPLAARHLRLLRSRPVSICSTRARALHLTPVVHKKKANVEIDDLFSDEVEEDLIQGVSPSPKASSSPKPQAQAKSSNIIKSTTTPSASASTPSPTPSPKEPTKPKRPRLSPKSRTARFDALTAFIVPRLGRKPEIKMPMVKKGAWAQLLQLATTEAQLAQVAEMFPGWRESGNEFDEAFGEAFVRRCEELSTPLLALRIFGSYAKYTLPLSLPAAQHLLHSLHTHHPLPSVMTAAALYPIYGLGKVEEDLVGCTLVMAACFREGGREAVGVGRGLVPCLERLLKRDGRRGRKVEEGGREGREERREVWVKWALGKVDKALVVMGGGERVDWLSVWRERRGHIASASKL